MSPSPSSSNPPTPPASVPHRLDTTGACPHATNALLRTAQGSVAEVLLPGDVAGMAVIGHEALKEFLAHPDVAKSPHHFSALTEGLIPDGWPLRPFATVPGMTTADGTDHRRLRSPVTKVFTPRRVETLRPGVEAATTALLDRLERMASRPDAGGVVDLRRHFALPLPMDVIGELLGVDEEYRDRLHTLSFALVSTDITPEELVAAGREMPAVLGAVVASRVRRPGEDLTSALLALREEDGERLGEAELVGTLQLMIVAGHATTLNLITNAVRALCAHRDQLELALRGGADWADVVEETLRWDSPVNFFPFRYPTRDLTLDGKLIPRGTPVLAGYGAAGRDTTAHGQDADSFDITRPSARHISLGHGPHYCLGGPLARMEATIALRQLFTRFPDLTPAARDEDLPRHPSFVGNSLLELPVRLGRSAA